MPKLQFEEDQPQIPMPIPHDHTKCERVRINVAGMKYETQLGTLERFPDTLLGNPEKRIQYYNPSTQEYYFDRSRHAFDPILYYYQSGGRFCRPENIPSDILLEDAEFYQLSQTVIDQFRIEEGLATQADKQDIIPGPLLNRKIYLLFDFPESSTQAEIVTLIGIFALFVSIVLFCIETIDDLELKHIYSTLEDGTITMHTHHDTTINDPFFFAETSCIAWFILELTLRFCTCPVLSRFLTTPVNVIDFIAIIPYFANLHQSVADTTADEDRGGHGFDGDEGHSLKGFDTAIDNLYLLRMVRVVRVFRIFKLSRHSKGLKILSKTLKASLNELVLLIFFIFLGVILFSSAIHFAEMSEDVERDREDFSSIPGGFWWTLITITTVGFGDVVPQTFWGKIVGSVCAVAGVLTIALPVPVIVSNFNYFYHQAIDEQDLRWINNNHVPSCPYRPAGFQNHLSKRHGHRKGRKVYSSEEEFGSLMKCDDKTGKRK